MRVSSNCSHLPEFKALVCGRKILAEDIFELELEVSDSGIFTLGQFVSFVREDGLCRSYSIAKKDHRRLYFHIQRIANGKMSNWLATNESLQKSITLKGPYGECVYWDDYKLKNLILIGTGTGLAPLYGVLQDALESKHLGSIVLIHGSLSVSYTHLTLPTKRIV